MKVLLFTGGLDSTAIAYSYRPDLCLTIDYGQIPAEGEIGAASAIARELSLKQEIITLDASALGSGALVGGSSLTDEMPLEWWPYRNQLLITIAATYIAKLGGGTLLIGTVKGDAAHCDGRPVFIETMDNLLSIQRPYSRLQAPGLFLEAHELVAQSGAPKELFGWTFSCHSAAVACGHCRGCKKHIDTLNRAFPNAQT